MTMSSVPPDLVGPVLQSNLAQRQVSAVRDRERVQQANAQRQQSAAIDEKGTTVETTDNDTQVHTDSEGQGSQGRAFSSPQETEETQPVDTASADGDEGRHIDLQA